MAAPTGNQFWKLRSKHGRDKLFATPELMWEAACEYFEWCEENPLMEVVQKRAGVSLKIGKGTTADIESDILDALSDSTVELPKMRPFTMQGLCRYLDCNTVYFNQFDISLKDKEDSLSKDFSKIITRIRETVYEQKFSGAASGFLNANIIARDLGLSDKQELTGKNGKDLVTTMTFVVDKSAKQTFASDESQVDK